MWKNAHRGADDATTDKNPPKRDVVYVSVASLRLRGNVRLGPEADVGAHGDANLHQDCYAPTAGP